MATAILPSGGGITHFRSSHRARSCICPKELMIEYDVSLSKEKVLLLINQGHNSSYATRRWEINASNITSEPFSHGFRTASHRT
jgi:hypothetical protein